jgi:hypothetical protein
MQVSDKKEQFSTAYLWAIASMAECSLSKPSVDDDSVDWTLSSKIIGKPKIDIQMKCTELIPATPPEYISFRLKAKNYADLIVTELMVPRILVVVSVPEDAAEWMSETSEELVLRRCARWISLRGKPESDNSASVTIRIPTTNLFTVASLNSIMEMAARGNPV